MRLKELWEKIKEALSASLPITLIVYILALTPLFDLSQTELIAFTVSAVLLIVGLGLFSLPVSDVAGLVQIEEKKQADGE